MKIFKKTFKIIQISEWVVFAKSSLSAPTLQLAPVPSLKKKKKRMRLI